MKNINYRFIDLMTREELFELICNIENKFAECITDQLGEETEEDCKEFNNFLDDRFREIFDYINCSCIEKEVKNGICQKCDKEVK